MGKHFKMQVAKSGGVSLRVLEAADKISFRLLVYVLALWRRTNILSTNINKNGGSGGTRTR
jgi:hypothetical protein